MKGRYEYMYIINTTCTRKKTLEIVCAIGISKYYDLIIQ